MKKLFAVLTMSIIAVAFSFNAKADINVTLKIDDASRLTGYIQYTDASYNYVQTDLDLTQFTGDGSVFTIPSSYGYVYINATEGNCIVSATDETTGNNANINGNTQAFFYLYSDATISVTSASIESTRTATCTVKVDNASKVNMSYYTGDKIELVNGDNTVKFNPNAETPFIISHANYGETLYSVTLNGKAETASYGNYYVAMTDGGVLDIKADFPDEPSTISFSYGDNEAEVLGCLSVKVGGVSVDNFDGKTLTAKLGQKISIIGNTNLYNFNYSISVDGTNQYFYGTYEFVATKAEHIINVNATKYETYDVNLTVDNTEQISIYVGNSNSPEAIVSGEVTAITLTSNSNYINVMPALDCYIASILVNGNEYSSSYGTQSCTVRNLNEGDNVVITSGKVQRDKSATIWVDDLNAAAYGYSVMRYSDRADITLISGEAVTINFDDADNPYYISFFVPTYCSVFQNGIYTSPDYEGSTNYYITFADGDALKIYLASEPEKFAVTFTQNVENAVSEVFTDGQACAGWASGFTALTGTQVALTLSENAKAIVSVDGVNLTPNENGQYLVEIAKDTNIEINDETSAIESVNVESHFNNNVYNMQGILLIKNASAAEFNTLPAGLYIVNGKKMLRK